MIIGNNVRNTKKRLFLLIFHGNEEKQIVVKIKITTSNKTDDSIKFLYNETILDETFYTFIDTTQTHRT